HVDHDAEAFQLAEVLLAVAHGGGENQVRPEAEDGLEARGVDPADPRLQAGLRGKVTEVGDPDQLLRRPQGERGLGGAGREGAPAPPRLGSVAPPADHVAGLPRPGPGAFAQEETEENGRNSAPDHARSGAPDRAQASTKAVAAPGHEPKW